MVKLQGPIFSLHASGSLAGALVFSSWKGRPYARELVIPSNPQSGAQVGRRAMFSYLSKIWDGLSTANQATWDDLAEELVASPFNAYIGVNMTRCHNFLAPSYVYPAAEGDAIGTWDAACPGVWEENRIELEPEMTMLNQNAGIMIFASLTTPLTTAVGNCIMVKSATSTGLKHYFWTPPSVATWYFNHRAFSIQGVLGPQRTESSAVPP